MITKNIWLNRQFSLFMPVFETFFALNAFHCAIPVFCGHVPKTRLFLLRPFVGFVDFKFKFCCEFWSWMFLNHRKMITSLFWWFKPIAFHLITHIQRFFSDHKPGVLWPGMYTRAIPITSCFWNAPNYPESFCCFIILHPCIKCCDFSATIKSLIAPCKYMKHYAFHRPY